MERIIKMCPSIKMRYHLFKTFLSPVLFVLILYVPVNYLTGLNQYKQRKKYLAQGHNTMRPVSIVDLLLNVLPIVCDSSVFVFVLLCITLCPF